MQGQGWETPEGAGEVPANNSRHKSMAVTRSSPLLSPGGTNTTRPRQTESSWFVGLTLSTPCQWLPKPHFFCQCPIQPTQLFFFFFLASASLLLPMLEWLVMLLRLEMLSEEFCRLMRSSGIRQRHRRDWERRDQPPATAPTPEHLMVPPPCTQSLLPPNTF